MTLKSRQIRSDDTEKYKNISKATKLKYISLYLKHSESLSSKPDAAAYRELDRIAENVLKAMEHAYKLGQWETCCRFGLSFCDVGNGYLSARSRWHELERCLGLAIHAAKQAGREHDEIALTGNLTIVRERLGKEVDPQAQFQSMLQYFEKNDDHVNAARAKQLLGRYKRNAGDFTGARELYDQALKVYMNAHEWANASNLNSQLGITAQLEGDYEKAEHYYREALRLARAHHIATEEPLALGNLGDLAKERGDKAKTVQERGRFYNEMEQLSSQALALQRELGIHEAAADTAFKLGEILRKRGEHSKSIEFCADALNAKKKLGDVRGIAEGYYNLALAHHEAGDSARTSEERAEQYRAALSAYSECLALEDLLQMDAAQGVTISQLGILYKDMGDRKTSREMHLRSLDIRRRLNDQQGISVDLHQLGMISHQLGDNAESGEERARHYNDAERFYEESLRLEESNNNRNGIAVTLSQLGILNGARGRLNEAEAMHERSLSIRTDLLDERGMCADLHQLGILAQMAGDNALVVEERQRLYALAERQYLKALEVGGRVPLLGQAPTISQLGTLYCALGDYDRAKAYHERSLALREQQHDAGGMATDLGFLGYTFQEKGDHAASLTERGTMYDDAESFLKRSLKVGAMALPPSQSASIESQLGIVCMRRKKFDSARTFLERSLDVCRHLSDKQGMIVNNFSIGMIEQELGLNINSSEEQSRHYAEAAHRYDECLVWANEIRHNVLVAKINAQKGVLAAATGDPQGAEALFESSLPLLRARGENADVAECLTSIAKIREASGDYSNAIKTLDEVINHLYEDRPVDLQDAIERRARVAGILDGLSSCAGNIVS